MTHFRKPQWFKDKWIYVHICLLLKLKKKSLLDPKNMQVNIWTNSVIVWTAHELQIYLSSVTASKIVNFFSLWSEVKVKFVFWKTVSVNGIIDTIVRWMRAQFTAQLLLVFFLLTFDKDLVYFLSVSTLFWKENYSLVDRYGQ